MESRRANIECEGKAPAWFVVTVDTEADDAWAHPDRVELSNMGRIDEFQRLSERYGVVPTYLVTYECATRDEAVSVLKPIAERGRCEIGHHLHAWTTPPLQQAGAGGVDRAWLQAFQSELPDSLFAEKAHCLSETIRQSYGIAPTAHRAGRWGGDHRTFAWLERNGFVADTSVIPLRSLEKNRGVRDRGPRYYSAARGPTQALAGGGLVEVPVTVEVPDSMVGRACAGYITREWPGTPAVSRLFRSRWVRGGRMLSLDPRFAPAWLEGMISRALAQGGQVINLALHSSELALGTSPFSRTPADLSSVWHNLEAIYAQVRRLGLRCAGLSQAAKGALAQTSAEGQPISLQGGNDARLQRL